MNQFTKSQKARIVWAKTAFKKQLGVELDSHLLDASRQSMAFDPDMSAKGLLNLMVQWHEGTQANLAAQAALVEEQTKALEAQKQVESKNLVTVRLPYAGETTAYWELKVDGQTQWLAKKVATFHEISEGTLEAQIDRRTMKRRGWEKFSA
jgi:hypothetical protein